MGYHNLNIYFGHRADSNSQCLDQKTPVQTNYAIQAKKNSGGILRSFHCESLNASRAFSMLRHIIPSSEPSVLNAVYSVQCIKRVEVVDSFCYLGSYIIDDCKSIRGVKVRFAMALHKMTQLNTIWKNRKISME